MSQLRLMAMAQRHLDRLTAVDASFLHQEGPTSHMHVGGLTLLEGPPPEMEEFLEQIRRRLHLVPRYRHKLAYTALDSGRPVWVDDPSFNLEFHVRHTALPAPGSWEQLRHLTARIFSQALDRSRPPVGDVADRGIRGRPLRPDLEDPPLLDRRDRGRGPRDGPVRRDPRPGSVAPLWTARGNRIRSRTRSSWWRRACAGRCARGSRWWGAPWAPSPTRSARSSAAREAAEGVGEIVWAGLNPAPATPLNVEIGPHRRFVGIAAQLEDFKLVKNALGGTVNDVVLAVVTGALRSFLIDRGVRTEGLEMRALVPVSVRTVGERHEGGNRIVVMRGPLPVYIADPLQRLSFVRHAMDGLKESKQALGAEVIAGAQNFAPPTMLAQASRLNFSTRLFNLIVTNVPGPQFPLYVLGRRMERVFPVAFLPENHALAVAIMSYAGEMNFGLLGDFDALPDIESIGESIKAELATLVALAKEKQTADKRAANTRARTSRPRTSSRATTEA